MRQLAYRRSISKSITCHCDRDVFQMPAWMMDVWKRRRSAVPEPAEEAGPKVTTAASESRDASRTPTLMRRVARISRLNDNTVLVIIYLLYASRVFFLVFINYLLCRLT